MMIRKFTFFFLILLSACDISVTLPEIVDMPADYGKEETQELLQSINYQALSEELLMEFPLLGIRLDSFTYTPLLFKSATGKPDRMVVRVDLRPTEDWEGKDDVEKYLAKFLESRLESKKELQDESE